MKKIFFVVMLALLASSLTFAAAKDTNKKAASGGNGKRGGGNYTFTAEAYQGETLIAKGDHTRFVVDKSRFLAGLSR